MSQLPTDCLNDIFEYLKDDIITLHSCLLVNRLWCKSSVKFLWRDTSNYNYRTYKTLISCLPNESKEILSKNGIITTIQLQNLQRLIMQHFVRFYQLIKFMARLRSFLNYKI